MNAILTRFTSHCIIRLEHDDLDKAQIALNMHYLGVKNANKVCKKTGRLVARFPDKETPEMHDAAHRLNMNYQFQVRGVVLVNGILVPQCIGDY